MHGTIEELTNPESVLTMLTNGILSKPITYTEDGDQSKPVRAASALVPDGYRIEHLPWEKSHEAPFKKRAERVLSDVESFAAYVGHHAEEGKTTVFVTPPTDYHHASALATFDDHGSDPEAAGWGEHTASLWLPRSEALTEWVSNDGSKQQKDQIAFAEFLEANIADIVNPEAATLLEVVTSLQSTNKVAFDSAVRLDNGQVQVRYSEEISATAGRQSTLEIPQEFTIAVPVFEFGARYAIKAKLRYRVKEQKLVLWYDLQRITDIVRDALVTGDKSVVSQLRDAFGDAVPVYLGSAGSAPRYGTLVAPVGTDDD